MIPPRPPPPLPPRSAIAAANDIQRARARPVVPRGPAPERLAADADLLQHLALEGFTGFAWEQFRTDLASYSIGKMVKWITSGKIFRLCAARGFGALPFAERTPEDAEDLAMETVAETLNYFRERVLLKRRWKVEGGASLKTFFIGACLRVFSNVYRRWHAHASVAAAFLPLDPSSTDHRSASRPDHRLQIAAEVRAVLATASDNVTRDIVIMRAQGYAENEIATELQLSRKAVESRIGRFNERNRHERVHQGAPRAVLSRNPRSGRAAANRSSGGD
jgi:DNA-directed RNA polymerase specialized sigma24 family protein